jgi:hypothetical protein
MKNLLLMFSKENLWAWGVAQWQRCVLSIYTTLDSLPNTNKDKKREKERGREEEEGRKEGREGGS